MSSQDIITTLIVIEKGRLALPKTTTEPSNNALLVDKD